MCLFDRCNGVVSVSLYLTSACRKLKARCHISYGAS